MDTPNSCARAINISLLIVFVSPFKIRLICEDVTPILLASSLWEICCFSHSFTIRSPGVLNDSSSDFAFSSISFTSVMIFHLSLYSRFSPLYFNTEYHLLQICITPASTPGQSERNPVPSEDYPPTRLFAGTDQRSHPIRFSGS